MNRVSDAFPWCAGADTHTANARVIGATGSAGTRGAQPRTRPSLCRRGRQDGPLSGVDTKHEWPREGRSRRHHTGAPPWSEGIIMIAGETMMARPRASTRADRTRGSVRILRHLTASPSRRTIVTLRSSAPRCATGMTLLGAIFQRSWRVLVTNSRRRSNEVDATIRPVIDQVNLWLKYINNNHK